MEVLYPHCAGLDVHKQTVVACLRHVTDGKVHRDVRSFKTMTSDLLALSEWLAEQGCAHIAMEATGVYWKPVWHILSDGDFTLTLANAAHVKNVPGRKTDVNDATWLADLGPRQPNLPAPDHHPRLRTDPVQCNDSVRRRPRRLRQRPALL